MKSENANRVAQPPKGLKERTRREERPVVISVVTPVFNGIQFIASCIESFLSQHCPEAELVITDGGSTDGTLEVIQRYAAEWSNIRWVSEPDKGQSDALNKGIRMSRGTILTSLNVDDYFEPGVFGRVLDVFEGLAEPAFVSGNCNVWGDGGRLLEVNRPQKLGLLDLLMGFDVNPVPANPSAYFYHKSLHDKAGYYDLNEHFAADIDFVLRAVASARTLVHIDETWGNFRFIPGTKTFSEAAEGRNWDRYNGILRSHRERLSAWDKARLEMKLQVHRSNLRARHLAKRSLRLVGVERFRMSQ